ncbi:uncharacterized protein [Dysidea avara]|uniref:uncharacterized protein isoform X3 n=1 Tax=Dysidea avara TaxID=196820 RepID=UPI003323A9CA
MATSRPKVKRIPCKRITSATSMDSTDGPDDLEASILNNISVRNNNNNTVKVRYSTILCTGESKAGKTKFCHSLMKQDTPPPGKGDFHTIFIKKKNESVWTEIDIKQLSVLIDKTNKLRCPSESKCTGTTDGDEVLDILILLDINVPTSTVCLLQPALVTFVAYKLYGKEDHVCNKTCEFIQELMSSYCFENKPEFSELEIENDFEKDFYTAFVGTIFDDDSNSEAVYNKEAALVHENLQKLESCVNCSMHGMPLSFWFSETDSYLHIVNLISAQEETIFKKLRDCLEDTVAQNSVYQIPITWVLLSLKILKLCCEQKDIQFLQYKMVLEKIWNTECKMPSETEFKRALQFFHHHGVLFHFGAVEGARDYVFVHCHWLFSQLKYLLTGIKDKGRNRNAKELLKKEGIMTSKMIKDIIFEGPGNMTLKTFLNLLCHLKFIAEVKPNDEYFMPSILESYECDEKVFDRYGSKCHDPLLITFSSGSMHRSVFCFLSAYIIKNMPERWSKLSYDKQTGQQHTFKDLITFSIEVGYYVCIIDKVFSLELCIYSKSQHCDPDLHSSVYSIVKDALRYACQSVEIPFEECRYGFLCSTCESNDHMMILSDHIAHCSKNNDSLHLSSSQKVWLKQKSLSESLPQQNSEVYPEEASCESTIPIQSTTNNNGEEQSSSVSSVERNCNVSSVSSCKKGNVLSNKGANQLIIAGQSKSPIVQYVNPDVSKPCLKLLQKNKVIAAVSAKWYQLGIELLEDDKVGHLANIRANNHNVTDCCYAMFTYWIQTQPKASWLQLVEALREPGVEMNDMAETVKGKFIGYHQSAPVDEHLNGENNTTTNPVQSTHHHTVSEDYSDSQVVDETGYCLQMEANQQSQ